MIGHRIDNIQGLFFDSKKVLAATSKAERRVLSRFGAYVRRTARSSIRKRKRTSTPGQPPSSHTGQLKKFIFFAYEPLRRSVIVGPVRLNSKLGDAPPALEYGGRSQIVTNRDKRRRVIRTVSIRPRPFMGPAFEKRQPELPAMWLDSVR